MQSGRQTLASLDAGLQEIHSSVQDIEQRVKQSSGALLELRRKQSGRFKRMAEIRLDNVISGELAEGLDTADQRARELIRQRGQKMGAVKRKIKAVRTQQLEVNEKRATAARDCARAVESLDKAEAVTQDKLQQDPEYLAQLDRTQQAERTAKHAQEKTQQAKATRKEKGRSYENDPLFSYLWQRKYGTSGYATGALARYLDDWVAALCKYDRARPNYASLLEIPERLDEHAKQVNALADEEFIKLTKLEVEAAAVDDIPARKAAVDEAQGRLDELDRHIEETEGQLHDLEQQSSRFASGEDEDFQRAIDTIGDAFERENLLTLYDYARATATTEDDILVQEIDEARDQLRQVTQTLADRKRMQQRQSERLKELEGIRRRFKRNRFDDPHSEFRNNALLSMALSQFLAGTVTTQELWRSIERAQHYRKIRSNPTFGTGGFRRRPGTWHTPFPRGGGLGGGLSGGLGGGIERGGGGGGGFRTGGGF